MAAVVSILLILAAYFTERTGFIDELGLFNPSYMLAHYGKLTYPVHTYFDSMVVHPPMHYFVIGELMRFGMTLYYAEATPTLIMALLCVFLIVRAPFTTAVKIGFLYGLWVSMAALSRTGVELFGMRPEGELNAAWLASLVLLESGRLKNWDPIRLFFGSLLMAYACTLHYYAGVGGLGVAVYLVWAAWGLRRRAWKPCLAIVAGGLLWAVPFTVVFLWPNRNAIVEFAKSQETLGSVRDVLQSHWNEYANWTRNDVGNFWLQIPVSRGIPVVLLSTPLLLALASTRGIALAALPLQIFILVFARHTHTNYLVHELAIYGVAAGAGALTLLDSLLLKQKRLPYVRRIGWALFGISIGVSYWNLDRWSGTPLRLTLRPRAHEAEIARAAGRAILGGPYASVATRIASWYTSGGTYWFNPAPDLLWAGGSLADFDAKGFFSHFDAVVENSHMSDQAENQQHYSLLSWYLDGALRLGGFFLADVNAHASGLYLKTKVSPVVGFGLRNGQLFRFDQAPQGDHALVVLTCEERAAYAWAYGKPFKVYMVLPKARKIDTSLALVATMVPVAEISALEASIPGAHVVERVRGDLTQVDWRKMVGELRQSDPAMQFYKRPEAMPGY